MKSTAKQMLTSGKKWLTMKRRNGTSLCWTSIGGYATIDLAHHGHCFKVYYPLGLSDDYDDHDVEDSSGKSKTWIMNEQQMDSTLKTNPKRIYRYARIQQVFSIHTIPDRWSSLSRILIQWYREIRTENLSVPDHEKSDDDLTDEVSSEGKIAVVDDESMIRIELENEGDIRPSLQNSDSRLEDLQLNKKMLDDAVLMAVAYHRECVFRCIANKNIVELMFLADYSFVMSNSQATEFEHFLQDEQGNETTRYTIEQCPETRYSSLYQKRYVFAAMLHKAREFLVEARKTYERLEGNRTITVTLRSTSSKLDEEQEFCSSIREHVMIPNWGEFTAFQDGRVRVRFVDRTHVELSQNRSHCKLMLNDGSFHEIDLRTPFDEEDEEDEEDEDNNHHLHIDIALKFSQWASASMEERNRWMMEDQKSQEVLEQTTKQSRQFLLDLAMLEVSFGQSRSSLLPSPSPLLLSTSTRITDITPSIIMDTHLPGDKSNPPYRSQSMDRDKLDEIHPDTSTTIMTSSLDHHLPSDITIIPNHQMILEELHQRNSRFLRELQDLLNQDIQPSLFRISDHG